MRRTIDKSTMKLIGLVLLMLILSAITIGFAELVEKYQKVKADSISTYFAVKEVKAENQLALQGGVATEILKMLDDQVVSVEKSQKEKVQSSYLEPTVADDNKSSTVEDEDNSDVNIGYVKVNLTLKQAKVEPKEEVVEEILEKKVETTGSVEPVKKTKKKIRHSAKSSWDGAKLTARKGVNHGPTGKETYYNMRMGNVISHMRHIGFSESKYPYWVRGDGVKMLGDYVIVAANLKRFPRGSLVECSLGMALVCDTGDFARSNPTQLDIAVTW